ncbi:hypothetical protein H2200_002477 [Cladophialophora chaetospira]|uniref:Uncharacterized protein n=1 Tax=Cladophialophora chaetospira TaxID=386627 RepID=A0AA38XJ18_9EURO|nr:hypothetical protein H2200_002477 [Cladophialophora chaetospira]
MPFSDQSSALSPSPTKSKKVLLTDRMTSAIQASSAFRTVATQASLSVDSLKSAQMDSPHPASQHSVQKPPSLLSLPYDVRVRIYEFLQPSIEVGTHSQVDAIRRKSRPSLAEQMFHVKIMDICQQISAEMKSLPALPRLTVSGRKGGLLYYTGCGFSEWGPEKVYKLVLDDSRFAKLWEGRLDFGFPFFDRKKCPNLRVVEFSPIIKVSPDPYDTPYWHRVQGHKRIYNITLPASPLPLVTEWLKHREGKTISGLSQQFNLATAWSTGEQDPNLHQNLQQTDALVRERDLELIIHYKFGLRGTDSDWPFCDTRNVLFEEFFEVLIVWDKDDVRIENLPEVRDMVWWREWVDSGKVEELDQFEMEVSEGSNLWVTCDMDLSRD